MRNHGAGGMLAHQRAAADFVVAGFDDGDAVGIEITHNKLAAIRFQDEAHRGAADVEQRQYAISPSLLCDCKRDGCHLRRSGTGDVGFAGIGEDSNFLRLPAHGQVARTRSCFASIRETVLSPRLDTTTVAPSSETRASPGDAPTRTFPRTVRFSRSMTETLAEAELAT